jgi:hypothetical protein
LQRNRPRDFFFEEVFILFFWIVHQGDEFARPREPGQSGRSRGHPPRVTLRLPWKQAEGDVFFHHEGLLMKLLCKLIVPAAVLLSLAGCSGQDSGQPAVNSISVGPKSDAPLAPAKKGSIPAAPAKQP